MNRTKLNCAIAALLAAYSLPVEMLCLISSLDEIKAAVRDRDIKQGWSSEN